MTLGLRTLLVPALLVGVLTASCTAPARESHLALVESGVERDLPPGWDAGPSDGFASLIGVLAQEPAEAWSARALYALRAALGGDGERALRAAVLLAQDPGPQASEALLARLERRLTATSRPADAPDVVSARALAGRDVSGSTPERLAQLVLGAEPHPDLEVRVECAAAALYAGRDEVAPFLVRVLRARTPAERQDPPDWPPITTLAWAKSRAAEALSLRLGRPQTFRPDGSWEHQMAEAQRFADAFAR